MNLREPDTISDQIAKLQLDLLELKTKQFTSQASGMIFNEEYSTISFKTVQGESVEYIITCDIETSETNLIVPSKSWSISSNGEDLSVSRDTDSFFSIFDAPNGNTFGDDYGQVQFFKTDTGYRAIFLLDLYGASDWVGDIAYTVNIKSTARCSLRLSYSAEVTNNG